MKLLKLTIEGMTCGHCVMHVRRELSNMQNVRVDDVQIGKAIVQYDDAKVSMVDFAQAIERAGYRLVM